MTETEPNPNHMASLYRYFIGADEMRKLHDRNLEQKGNQPAPEKDVMWLVYLSQWYGNLYVVAEGWQELRLSDPVVDGLLESPNLNLLKRYRNGAFHFQKKFYDDRFLDFMDMKGVTVDWVRSLHQEFGRYFRDWFRERRSRHNP